MTRSMEYVQIQNVSRGDRESPKVLATYLYKSGKSSRATENKMSSNRISSHLEGSVLGSTLKHLQKQYSRNQARLHGECYKSEFTQTDYRETDCQTLPWEPPYTVPEGQNPEVLTIAHFTWGDWLPAGMHEIDIINRMRKKRAWEKIMPPMDTPANIKSRSDLIKVLEDDEWSFREAEIQFLMDLRMELEEQVRQSKEDEKNWTAEARFKRLDEKLCKRKQRELETIRKKFSRDLRRLSIKHKKAKREKRDVVKLQARRDCDFSVLKPRYECSPTLQEHLYAQEIASHDSVKDNVMPKWLIPKARPVCRPSKCQPTKICLRRLRKNEKKILELTQYVEAIQNRVKLPENCSLLKRKEKIPSLPPTPRRSPDSDDLINDDVEQSCNLLQRIVNGRAAQCEILEGRNRYRELIEELQVVRALEGNPKDLDETARMKALEEERQILREQRATEILEALEGKTISAMLTFLTDELKRLHSEKKAHALSLLAERELVRRRVVQSGKEQHEVNKREEIDEIFRHILKVNQESVETYLEDIVREGVEWLSESEAKKYVVDLADKTEAMTKRLAANTSQIESEGLVADMVYNLLMPEVDRELSKNKLHEKQMSHLQAAHESIYQEIFNIASEDLLSEQFQSDRLNSADECPTSCQCTSTEDEENSEIKSAYEISCKGSDAHESYEPLIESILEMAAVTDEESKKEIRLIMKEMFLNAGTANI